SSPAPPARAASVTCWLVSDAVIAARAVLVLNYASSIAARYRVEDACQAAALTGMGPLPHRLSRIRSSIAWYPWYSGELTTLRYGARRPGVRKARTSFMSRLRLAALLANS